METTSAVQVAAQSNRIVIHADNDEMLVRLWLEGRPTTTHAAYRRDASVFLAFVAQPLRSLKLGDLHDYAASLTSLAPASQVRKLAAVKSLFAFGHRLGYFPFDLARALHLPRVADRLAERIITEAEAQRLIALEPNPRNHAMLRLMYACGLRISEACGLCWRDLKGSKTGGQAAVHGKGGKTRHVVIPPKLWRMVQALRAGADNDAPVFRSRQGGHVDRGHAHRIVKAAVERAGLPEAVSAHWLRHACASHSLDNGAPVHVVASSLGHASLATTTRYAHARPGDGVANYLPE